MEISNNVKLLWREDLRDQLECLSSIDFQRKCWVEAYDESIWWDWSDAIAGYFNDLSMSERHGTKKGIFEHLTGGDLSREEVEILLPFNKKLRKYAKRYYGRQPSISELEETLVDPRWIEVTNLAKEILNKIDFSKLPNKK